ncbi:MAG: hypothetical protein UX83_C0011G0009 [Candidatus Wolfebacteria bacterium GW2011_GWE2_47_12]|nr:MAG: hypothetical protein UX83_C0011G0009 [Candidatus Wolfebacteria bacterium GW2011_GWE2_47_12]
MKLGVDVEFSPTRPENIRGEKQIGDQIIAKGDDYLGQFVSFKKTDHVAKDERDRGSKEHDTTKEDDSDYARHSEYSQKVEEF